MDSSRLMIAYAISERGGKNYWHRIGIAFRNSDGSLNVKLECLPVTGELHLREYVSREDESQNTGSKWIQDQACDWLGQAISRLESEEERKAFTWRVRKLFGK